MSTLNQLLSETVKTTRQGQQGPLGLKGEILQVGSGKIKHLQDKFPQRDCMGFKCFAAKVWIQVERMVTFSCNDRPLPVEYAITAHHTSDTLPNGITSASWSFPAVTNKRFACSSRAARTGSWLNRA